MKKGHFISSLQFIFVSHQFAVASLIANCRFMFHEFLQTQFPGINARRHILAVFRNKADVRLYCLTCHV